MLIMSKLTILLFVLNNHVGDTYMDVREYLYRKLYSYIKYKRKIEQSLWCRIILGMHSDFHTIPFVSLLFLLCLIFALLSIFLRTWFKLLATPSCKAFSSTQLMTRRLQLTIPKYFWRTLRWTTLLPSKPSAHHHPHHHSRVPNKHVILNVPLKSYMPNPVPPRDAMPTHVDSRPSFH